MSNVGKRDQENMTFLNYPGEYQAICEGRILPATWNSKGAAEAGLTTEQRRLEAKREAKREIEQEQREQQEQQAQHSARTQYADERDEVEPMPRIEWPPVGAANDCLPIGDAVALVAEKLFRVWQGVAPDLNVADNDEAVDAVIDRAYDDLTTEDRFIIAHHKDAVRDKLKLV